WKIGIRVQLKTMLVLPASIRGENVMRPVKWPHTFQPAGTVSSRMLIRSLDAFPTSKRSWPWLHLIKDRQLLKAFSRTEGNARKNDPVHGFIDTISCKEAIKLIGSNIKLYKLPLVSSRQLQTPKLI
ncbi:unnamed protein product, partial [Prunus brigantina]